MEIGDLEQLLSLHPEVDILAKELSKKREKHFLLKNLHASAQAIILSALANKLAKQQARNLLIVLDNAEQAQYLFSDLRTLRKDQGVYLFPTSHRRRQGKDEAMAVQRTEVLSALIMDKRSSGELMGNGYRVSDNGNEVMIITYPEALSESVPAPQALQKQTIQIAVEEEIAQSSIIKQLVDLNFKRVDFVYEPGQFAVRGGILDVYSYAHDNPYRIDFFGDEVDSIREFDLETQLSLNRIQSIQIVADSGNGKSSEESYLTDYLNEDTIWVSNDFGLVKYKLGDKAPQKSADFSGTPQVRGERLEVRGERREVRGEEHPKMLAFSGTPLRLEVRG